jgi:hypothetical protein
MTQAWTRKEGKNPSGGLNAKGRASYNAANPGKPGLKPPAPHPKTEKDAGRRKSFCARMTGMEGPMKKPDGKPTRKALSLKAWNFPLHNKTKSGFDSWCKPCTAKNKRETTPNSMPHKQEPSGLEMLGD